MIKIERNNNGAVAPIALVGVIEKQSNDQELLNEHQSAIDENRNMKFKSSIYGCSEVKDQLKLISYGKCSYCDYPIISVEHCDVEHFRPKSRYWWLAYTWDNLLLSCQICNQIYKRNYFPVTGNRANEPNSDLTLEQQLLINPVEEDPEQFFIYDSDGDEVSIIPRSNNVKKRVNSCIRYYGLNREELLDARRFLLKTIQVFKALVDNPSLSQADKQMVKDEMKRLANDDAPLAGLVRFYLTLWGII